MRAMRVFEASVRLLMFRFQTPIEQVKPKPVVFDKAPLAVVDVPSPILSVPPVINFPPPVVPENAVPAAALCGSTIVMLPPVQLTVVEPPTLKTAVAAARVLVAFGSTLKLPPLIMNCVLTLLPKATAPSMFSVPPVIVKMPDPEVKVSVLL